MRLDLLMLFKARCHQRISDNLYDPRHTSDLLSCKENCKHRYFFITIRCSWIVLSQYSHLSMLNLSQESVIFRGLYVQFQEGLTFFHHSIGLTNFPARPRTDQSFTSGHLCLTSDTVCFRHMYTSHIQRLRSHRLLFIHNYSSRLLIM